MPKTIQNLPGFPAFKTAMDSAMMYIALGDLDEIESNRLLEVYKTVLRFFRTGELPQAHPAIQEVYGFALQPHRFMAFGLPDKEWERVEYDQQVIKRFIEQFYGCDVMIVSQEEGVINPLHLKRPLQNA